MGQLRDLTGQRFGDVVVVKRLGSVRYETSTSPTWECICGCGSTFATTSRSLLRGQAHCRPCVRKRSRGRSSGFDPANPIPCTCADWGEPNCPKHKKREATEKKKQGFAVMAPERVREIAQKGGLEAQRRGVGHRWTREEASVAGRKGGAVLRMRCECEEWGLPNCPVHRTEN